MNRNLLIIEDEREIRKLLALYFQKENFEIAEAENGEEGLFAFRKNDFDLVILDIMLPMVDGFEVCRKIREISDVPIIMLTARSQDADKLRGFENGADEYVTKPFSPRVLVARANSLLSRAEGRMGGEKKRFSAGGMTVDFDTQKVQADGREILLTHKELDLLLILIRNRDIVLPKETILDKVWGIDYYGDPRTVDTHIRRLREKMGKYSRYIKTVRGRGYSFAVPAETEERGRQSKAGSKE